MTRDTTATTERDAILSALGRFVAQRPGVDPRNYGGGPDGWRAYSSEVRSITRDLQDARQLLRAVQGASDIDAAVLRDAFRAFAGRLSVTTRPTTHPPDTCPGKPCSANCDHTGAPWTATLDYCTGQYWPTEYRKAVCAVLAAALWDKARAEMPAPSGKITRTHGQFATEHDDIEGLTPGDWLRRHFRRLFGRGIANRWFS